MWCVDVVVTVLGLQLRGAGWAVICSTSHSDWWQVVCMRVILLSSIIRVTSFLEFLETWKGQGKGTKSGKGRGICVVRDI